MDFIGAGTFSLFLFPCLFFLSRASSQMAGLDVFSLSWSQSPLTGWRQLEPGIDDWE